MKSPNESPNQPQDANAPEEMAGRRRFIGASTAGVVLAVTGRSAMASGTSTTTKCLSPLAWASLHPSDGVTAQLSHTVSQTCVFGKSPGGWTPNCGGDAKAFQWLWPVNPFSPKLTGTKDGKPFQFDLSNYIRAKGVAANDAGWAGGAFLPFYRTDKSISRLLLDSASSGVERHICAAYLNIRKYPGYPVTLEELEKLATGQPVGGRIFTTSEVKTFLDQTWL